MIEYLENNLRFRPNPDYLQKNRNSRPEHYSEG
jgi:hypothetical protein